MSSRRQYLLNILWSWVSAVALILNAALVAPYLIRRLGTEEYGIWALGLSLVEYFWMIDLGVRPATVKLTAEYRALEKWDMLNALLSTAVSYSALMGFLVLLLISLNSGWIARFFHISHPSFPILIQAVSLSWALGLVFNVFAAALEGFQRFDITSRIFMVFLLSRSVLLLTITALGYGLVAMSLGLLTSQVLMYVIFFVSFRRQFPRLQLSPRLVSRQAGREIWLYARQMISAVLAGRLLQAIPSLIARFLPVQNVTYYTVTQKTLEYAGEGIGRVGVVTGPRASDVMARGYVPQILRLAQYGNRYCLALWIVFGSFFLVYGRPLFHLWVGAETAETAAVLLPIMLFGHTLWLGQFISASILLGTGRYGEYSASLLAEAMLTLIGFAAVLPHYGLAAAVAVASGMVFLNRCLNLSWIFCRKFQIDWLPFLWRIYRLPLALGSLDALGLWVLQKNWAPGTTWGQLIGVGLAHAVVYGGAVFWLVLEPEHQALLLRAAEEKWRGAGQFLRRTKVARGVHGSGGNGKE